ncbi:hypothetical protein EYE42_07285 [Paracoccus subflavus]|uniref:Integrase catalytic domain-containing protein n=1 Tax=Paracoccus subflavus TaxID=2528244 RepID=A0A4Q9G1Q5_9RHOB|nr:hypothetical protein EYE42_07285 [Paracoccus subflavus]
MGQANPPTTLTPRASTPSCGWNALGQPWFLDLSDAQEKVEKWRRQYNEVRPHGAIRDRSPQIMISRLEAPPRAANPPEVLI